MLQCSVVQSSDKTDEHLNEANLSIRTNERSIGAKPWSERKLGQSENANARLTRTAKPHQTTSTLTNNNV